MENSADEDDKTGTQDQDSDGESEDKDQDGGTEDREEEDGGGGGGSEDKDDGGDQELSADREALLAILDKMLGSPGTLRPVPGWTKKGTATSCGDFVGMVLLKWGSHYGNRWFMIDDPEKPGEGNMPEVGDVFVLKKKNGERAHVGFVYRIEGDADSFTWQSAEGGQGPNGDQMWISPKKRGIHGEKTDLEGWKSLDDIPRDSKGK